MSCEWRQTTIGEQVTLQRGFDITRAETRSGRIPIYSSGGLLDFHDTAMVQGPGVIIGRKGSLGTCYYVEQDYWPHDTTLWVKDFKGNYPKFVYYFLQNLDVMHLDVGSANPTLNRNHVHPISTIWPPLHEQKRIAHILGTLDDKIELNRKMNRTLEAMARAIFKSWFIDFDPVRAKMEGRQPHGMPPETAALFPDKLVDSELGRIPEGWEVKKLGDVTTVFGGSTPSTKILEYWEPPINYWATPKDLSGMESPILLSTERRVSDAGLEKITNGLRPAGSLLMSKRAPIGYLAIATMPTAINQGFVAMEFPGHISNYWMLNWLHFNMEVVKSHSNGSTFKEISQTNFKNLPLVEPNKDIPNRFNAIVHPIYQKIEVNLKEVISLQTQRDTLLTELLTNRLTTHDH